MTKDEFKKLDPLETVRQVIPRSLWESIERDRKREKSRRTKVTKSKLP